ncbi:thiamine phosphate synthase [Pseudomonadota bacterium]
MTDSQRLSNERFFEVVSEALTGGVDALLVREKQMDSARLLAFASRLREFTTSHGAKLIIHTQADIAKAVGADGVHLASSDLAEIPSVREWLNKPEMTISASCHNEIELGFAERFGADYAFLSPVFPTQSHPGEPHLGIDKFREMAETTSLPVIALGGINSENRNRLKGFGVAVIGAILNADDPKAAATGLV